MIEKGKKPKLSNYGDAFGLGMMISDILTGFKYYDGVKDSSDYFSTTATFPDPEGVDSLISSKLRGLLEKVPTQRTTIATFSDLKMFKSGTVKRVMTISDTKNRAQQSVDVLNDPLGDKAETVTTGASKKIQDEVGPDEPATKINPFSDSPAPAALDPFADNAPEQIQKPVESPVPLSIEANGVSASEAPSSIEQNRVSSPVPIENESDKSNGREKEPGVGDTTTQKYVSIKVPDEDEIPIQLPEPQLISPINLPPVDFSNLLSVIDNSRIDMSFNAGRVSETKALPLNSDNAATSSGSDVIEVPPQAMGPPILNSRQIEREHSETGSVNLPDIIVVPTKTAKDSETDSIFGETKPKPKPPPQALKPKSRQSELKTNINGTTNANATAQPNGTAGRRRKPKKTGIIGWYFRLPFKTKIILVTVILVTLIGTLIGILFGTLNNKSSTSVSVPTSITDRGTYETNVTVSTLAGTGTAGLVNGVATAARFQGPEGIACDGSGNIYVADTTNNVIRMISAAGIVTTFAGNGTAGFADGPAATAQFNSPVRVAVTSSGDVYVADYQNHRIRKITQAGVVSTLVGNGTQGSQDGVGSSATITNPYGLVSDSAGNLIVSDGNHFIRTVDTATATVTKIAGTGTRGFSNGNATSSNFNAPYGLAVLSNGTVFVADTGNNCIRKIEAGVVSTIVGRCGPANLLVESANFGEGTGTNATFYLPYDVNVSPSGSMIVVDSYNHRLRKVTSNWVVTTLTGGNLTISNSNNAAGFINGPGNQAKFNLPAAICQQYSGVYALVDNSNHVIRNVTVW